MDNPTPVPIDATSDGRAVVKAVDALREQVQRVADFLAASAHAAPSAPTAGDQVPRCVCGGPIEMVGDPGRWVHRPVPGELPLDAHTVRLPDGVPSPVPAGAAEGEQTLRWARRESLLVLLTRLQRGRHLTEDETRTLRHHVETEMREADTAREVARGNLRHVRVLVPELEQAQAAVERVRALRDPIAEALEQADYRAPMRRGDFADSIMPVIHAALDGTEQPTTPEGTGR